MWAERFRGGDWAFYRMGDAGEMGREGLELRFAPLGKAEMTSLLFLVVDFIILWGKINIDFFERGC